jgi:hypothetical protein
VVLPADHQPTEVMKPSKKSLHSPTPAVAPQGTAILSRLPALSAMRSDHRDAIALGQISIQAVAVVGFVADQSCRKRVEKTLREDSFDKLAFVRRSAFDTNRERKTVIIGESDDFRPLAALGRPDREAPFLAPVKEASIKASSTSSFSLGVQLFGQHAQDAFQLVLPHPLLEATMAGLIRRIFLGQLAPLCPGAQDPQDSIEHRLRISTAERYIWFGVRVDVALRQKIHLTRRALPWCSLHRSGVAQGHKWP